jgi:fatty-acyl-CoA synthase
MSNPGNFRMGLSQAILHWGKYCRNKAAVISETRTITYNDLDKAVESLAQRLNAYEGSNKRIAIYQTDPIIFFISLISILRSNNVACIMNAELAIENIRSCVQDCDAKLLLVDEETSIISNSIIKELDIPNMTIYLSELDKMPAKASWPLPNPYDPWGIVYTSGTTNIPIGIILSHISIFCELMHWFIELEMTKKTRLYTSIPPYLTAGLVLASTSLMTGGTVVNFRNHSSEILSSYLKINNIDISFFSPSGLQEFISYIKSHHLRIYMGDKILIMGEPVPLGLKKETRDLLSVDIIESWGNSEGLGTITEASDVEIRPNSIGRPFLCDDNFIMDENNNKLPDNEIGRIAGKTNCAFSGYNKRYDLSSIYIIGDTIFSDDFGLRDEDGYFYIKDRMNNSFIRNNERIYTIELEHKIQKLSCVEQVEVVGLESEEGTVPAAVIRLKTNDIDKNILIDTINAGLSANQKIQYIKFIDKFPKSAVGENYKNKLKNLFIE